MHSGRNMHRCGANQCESSRLWHMPVYTYVFIFFSIVNGYVIWPSGQLVKVKSTDLHLSRVGEDEHVPPRRLCFSALAG